jgi:hypothetical protein
MGEYSMTKIKLDAKKLLGYNEKKVGAVTQVSKIAGGKVGIGGKGGRPNSPSR